ncbi:MAG: PilZ domain-containing protein [Planctomycetota bacterium]
MGYGSGGKRDYRRRRAVDSETGTRAARDRRRHPRFADDARVLCVADAAEGGFYQARLTELSRDGMRLLTDRPFATGSQLYAGIFLPESQEPLVMLGVVQHCDTGADGAKLGLEFLSVTEEQQAALARLEAYLSRRHGEEALVTVHAAPPIRRIGEERWW